MEKYYAWMKLFQEKVYANKEYLSELDTPIGDGDHGGNMVRGTQAVLDMLEDKKPNDLENFYKTVAMAMLSKVGGASGPLYGTAFMAMAKHSDKDIVSQIEAGFEGIQKRGKSSVGEKTMLDVWGPALEDLKKNRLSVERLQEYVASTKAMKATKGRASYLGERSIGHIDPGAMSSMYFFEAMLEAGVLDE